LTFVIFIGYVYSELSYQFLYDITERPYVYRQLVPILSWGVRAITGVSFDTSVRIILIFAFIGMEEALRYFHRGFYHGDIKTEVYIILTSLIVAMIGMWPPHTYDALTVALFSFAFALLHRGRLMAFFLLFPIICLNRETSFLLILCFIVYTWQWLSHRQIFLLTSLSGIVYLTIRMALEWSFRTYPGYDTMFRLPSNIDTALTYPYIIISHMIIFLLILSMVHTKWIFMPRLIKNALCIFAPVLIIAYLTIGFIMEIRVFLEIVPLLTFIGLQEPPWMKYTRGVLRQNDNKSIREQY